MDTRETINIIDFDHTIYDGDATLDFYFYCLKKKPGIIRYAPKQLFAALLFVLKQRTRTQFKSAFLSFLRSINEPEKMIDDFWNTHSHKIKDWYIDRQRRDDVVVSASPEFLLRKPTNDLGVYGLIATVADVHTGEISGENCRGKEKVRRITQMYAGVAINEVYSDSHADLPILGLARTGYLVKGNHITKFER